MSNGLYRVYVEGEGEIPGVPRRSLTREEYEALPKWQQQAVDGSALYRAAPTPPAEPKAAKQDKER